jgi:hypothetical protein
LERAQQQHELDAGVDRMGVELSECDSHLSMLQATDDVDTVTSSANYAARAHI